jgi:hypothetical protein
VRQVRIIILVLLAVLLPVRGAVAATMLCSGSATPITAGPATAHDHHGMQADHDMHANHGGAEHAASEHHHPEPAGPDDDSSHGGHANTCNSCANGCCMASVVGTVPTLARPIVTGSVTFPALASPLAAFHSGGQDRPPRTL